MSMRKNVALSFGALSASPASAQIIYEPVQSEYRTEHGVYHYGGSDPMAHEWAYRRLECLRGYAGTHEGRYGYGYIHRKLIGRPPEYVVSDCAPYLNAAAYGYSSTDARHEAYGHSAGYFRKSDLLKEAVPAADGKGVVVPASAGRGTIDIRPYRRPMMPGPSTRPSTNPEMTTHAAPADTTRTEPKPVLIIPKKMLEKQADPEKSVVSAK